MTSSTNSLDSNAPLDRPAVRLKGGNPGMVAGQGPVFPLHAHGNLFEFNRAHQHLEGCTVPTWSPWGTPHDAYVLAPGVVKVMSSSHGGIRVDEQRQAQMPTVLRHASGWYEEDQDISKVGIAFPKLFPSAYWETCREDLRRMDESLLTDVFKERSDLQEVDRAYDRHTRDFLAAHRDVPLVIGQVWAGVCPPDVMAWRDHLCRRGWSRDDALNTDLVVVRPGGRLHEATASQVALVYAPTASLITQEQRRPVGDRTYSPPHAPLESYRSGHRGPLLVERALSERVNWIRALAYTRPAGRFLPEFRSASRAAP